MVYGGFDFEVCDGAWGGERRVVSWVGVARVVSGLVFDLG